LVKPNTPDHPFMAANEFVAARLATALGLPVPFGEIAHVRLPSTPEGDETLAWVSAQVGLGKSTLPPPDMKAVLSAREETLSGVVVFDVWVNNIDRTEDNVIYHPRIGLWIIDHDQAFSAQDGPMEQVLAGSRQNVTNFHLLPRPAIRREKAQAWIERIQQSSLGWGRREPTEPKGEV
jgi:hypothetical protein